MATRAPHRTTTAASDAWALLQRIMMSQRGLFFEVASELDLAPAQMHALKALEPGEPKPMSELAGALRCDNSNVTGIVDRLEDRGFVRRRPSERDRRVKMLEVTPEGARVRAKLHERLSRPPEALARLSEEDARTLRDLLARALAD